jgi:RNA polymerase sigma-70 factor (ECF subfamily)
MTFEEIYREYAAKIYRLCMAYVNDRDMAQDLTQDTFATVWEKLATFRNESAIGTWVYRIATNKCLRSLEQTTRIKRTELPPQLSEPPEAAHGEEMITRLYQCIAGLEEVERIIISLELEEVPQAEIATIVGISEGNVRIKIHRIKNKLEKKLKEYEEF